MAMLSSEIIIRHEVRPCFVKGRKALFHAWREVAEVVPPSMMVGGHNGGQLKKPCAVIEFEDGKVRTVSVECIQFIDSKIKEYYFGEERDETCNATD